MAVTEAVARLEAELRGWTVSSPGWLRCDGKCLSHHSEPVKAAHMVSDPETPTGAWEWVRLLRLNIFAPGYSYEMDAATPITWWSAMQAHAVEDGHHRTPVAAVAAAVEALAESHAKGEPPAT